MSSFSHCTDRNGADVGSASTRWHYMSFPRMLHSRPRVSGIRFFFFHCDEVLVVVFGNTQSGACVANECVIHPGGTASAVVHKF